jgi:hypothetical protein
MPHLQAVPSNPRCPGPTRLAWVICLIGAACLAGPISVAAQTAPASVAAQTPPIHHHHTAHKTAAQARETLENRIRTLHSELQITPEEETKWTAVAQVMRDNEAAMQRMVAERRGQAPNGGNAVDELKTYERFTQAHVNGLKDLISAFETLYSSMPATQQAVADHVFKHFGRGARSSRS